ncbi:hypothetical protein [Salarchaeum sp. JOR-1]|uniref:hypothetical protein n=1 Tax=Salarchaeum sp. JOR-1 TaxID=2599399 RepID=UPI001198747E|nr:hypothetical protein [Salarchaeum sp. JOR-1]QDX41768.1 hypothetical protein FQU85_12945 [Salarchaeum sp. JOR-1]
MDRTQLVAWARQPDTPLEEDLFTALDHANVDLDSQRPPIVEFVDLDALEKLTWANPALEVQTAVWGYPLEITAAEIRVYARDTTL